MLICVVRRGREISIKIRLNNALLRSQITLEGMPSCLIFIITQLGQQRENQMKKCELNIRYLWDNIKWANLCMIGIPEGEEKDNSM